MDDQESNSVIGSESELRSNYGEPMDIAVKKELGKLDKHCKDFISRSPFLCIGTSAADGKADVSPRGDPPGFVQVLDDNTLFIPDRPGNNRLDTMGNIIANPNVGLFFMIPGFEDTLRVNGKARIVKDKASLRDLISSANSCLSWSFGLSTKSHAPLSEMHRYWPPPLFKP